MQSKIMYTHFLGIKGTQMYCKQRSCVFAMNVEATLKSSMFHTSQISHVELWA